MKRSLFVIFLFLTITKSFARGQVTIKCPQQSSNDSVIYSSDFKWGYDLPGLIETFNQFYVSPKRLDQHAYFDQQKNKYYLPFYPEQGGLVELPNAFIDSVTQHIQKAYEKKYIDAVFFPDMGHSHFLIPEKKYQKEYAPIPTKQTNLLYQKIFNDPDIKVVYHTAEQLKYLDDNDQPLPDKQLQWRFLNRNLVGDNTVEKKIEIYSALDQNPANTLSEVKGYHWWGAGFNLSANKNGCFKYTQNGKDFYYDISLFDLPSDPSSGGVFLDK